MKHSQVLIIAAAFYLFTLFTIVATGNVLFVLCGLYWSWLISSSLRELFPVEAKEEVSADDDPE